MDEKKRLDAERALEYTIAHAVAESGLTMEEAIGSMSRVQEVKSKFVCKTYQVNIGNLKKCA